MPAPAAMRSRLILASSSLFQKPSASGPPRRIIYLSHQCLLKSFPGLVCSRLPPFSSFIPIPPHRPLLFPRPISYLTLLSALSAPSPASLVCILSVELQKENHTTSPSRPPSLARPDCRGRHLWADVALPDSSHPQSPGWSCVHVPRSPVATPSSALGRDHHGRVQYE